MNATKKLVMAAAVVGIVVMMSACASGKTIKQGAEEFSITEAKYYEALELQDGGQYFKAITAWNELLDDEPRFAQGHFDLGLIYDKLNLVPEATEQYELAVQYAQDSAEMVGKDNPAMEDAADTRASLALYNTHLGAAYLRAGLVDEGIDALNAALKDDPYNATIHYNLSAAYMARKNFDDALTQADIAVDLTAHPDSKRGDGLDVEVDRERLGHYLLRQAACHLARKEYDKARIALERAETQCGAEVPAAMWEKLDAAPKPEEEAGTEG